MTKKNETKLISADMAGANMQFNPMAIVEAAFFTPMGRTFSDEEAWGPPILWTGGVGVGKTASNYAFARRMGVPFEALKPGSRGEGFFGCVPTTGIFVDAAGKEHRCLDFPLPRKFLESFTNNRPGMILIDEFRDCPAALQPYMNGLLQERELGEVKFSPRVRMMATANPVETSAAGVDISRPAANRLGHIAWPTISVEEYAQILQNTIRNQRDSVGTIESLEAREQHVLEQFYGSVYPAIVGKVLGFLVARRELLSQEPAADSTEPPGAFATPRSWETTARAMAGAVIANLAPTERLIYSSAFLGAGAITEFLAWEREADLPDPTEFLKGRANFTHSRARADRTMAMLHGCVGIFASTATAPRTPERMELIESFWRWVNSIVDTAGDLVSSIGQTAGKYNMVMGEEFSLALRNVSGITGVIQKYGVAG